jgi:hypothetical protein
MLLLHLSPLPGGSMSHLVGSFATAIACCLFAMALTGVEGHFAPLTAQEPVKPACSDMECEAATLPDTVDGYRSTYLLASGDEIVLVILGASFCGAQREPGFPQAIEAAKVRVQALARSREQQFRTVAVSLDWDVEEALGFVRSFGRFDEVTVGGNWVSDGAARYVWDTFPGEPVVPQLIVMERRVDADSRGIRFGPARVLKRLLGTEQIQEWVIAGAPL